MGAQSGRVDWCERAEQRTLLALSLKTRNVSQDPKALLAIIHPPGKEKGLAFDLNYRAWIDCQASQLVYVHASAHCQFAPLRKLGVE
jgi:hypothetical protein